MFHNENRPKLQQVDSRTQSDESVKEYTIQELYGFFENPGAFSSIIRKIYETSTNVHTQELIIRNLWAKNPEKLDFADQMIAAALGTDNVGKKPEARAQILKNPEPYTAKLKQVYVKSKATGNAELASEVLSILKLDEDATEIASLQTQIDQLKKQAEGDSLRNLLNNSESNDAAIQDAYDAGDDEVKVKIIQKIYSTDLRKYEPQLLSAALGLSGEGAQVAEVMRQLITDQPRAFESALKEDYVANMKGVFGLNSPERANKAKTLLQDAVYLAHGRTSQELEEDLQKLLA